MDSSDQTRKLIDLCVQEGRRRQSNQTGFVHYFPGKSPEDPHTACRVEDNLLFALGLMRTHTAENIQEAKELCKRLMHFQGQEGNFPVNLLDYPVCKNRYLGLKLLLPLHLIITHYGNVLGAECTQQLATAFKRLLEYCKSLDFSSIPSSLSARAAHFLSIPLSLPRECDTAEQLLSLSDEKTPILAAVSADWNPHLATTVSLENSPQNGYEPAITLLDLLLFQGLPTLPARALVPDIALLQTALLPKAPFLLNAHPLPSTLNRQDLFMHQTAAFAYVLSKREIPFKLFWGGLKRLHTLVCQKTNGQKVSWNSIDANHFEIYFELEALSEEANLDGARDICLFFDQHPESSLLVEGEKANTFRLGETITLHSPPISLTATFTCNDPACQFLGHINKGNRAGQIATAGSNRFEAFDWQFYLRPLRRKQPCIVTCRLSIASSV